MIWVRLFMSFHAKTFWINWKYHQNKRINLLFVFYTSTYTYIDLSSSIWFMKCHRYTIFSICWYTQCINKVKVFIDWIFEILLVWYTGGRIQLLRQTYFYFCRYCHTLRWQNIIILWDMAWKGLFEIYLNKIWSIKTYNCDLGCFLNT